MKYVLDPHTSILSGATTNQLKRSSLWTASPPNPNEIYLGILHHKEQQKWIIWKE